MSAPGAPKKSRRSHESIPDEDDVQPIDVFCVEPSDPSITKNELDYYLETFTVINDCGVGAVWLSEEKALEVSSIDDAFYFVAVFRGRVFEHLKKIGVNLYGVHVVRQTLSIGGCLPRWDFPVYALNLTGACVCFTGLSLQKREELKVKTNYMNGVVSPSLTEKVTHLVTDYCDTASRKYTEARRMGLPIMSPLWIDQAWEAAQAFSLENFVSNEATQRYRLPIFSKMVITATGVGGRERMDIARLIELNGGRFSGDMKRNECTHLIADKTRGVKFKKAREWNTIKIVRSSWLRKSVIAGYVLPESAFDPEKRNRCSTPVLDSRIPEHEELEYSAISGKGGRLDNSTFNTQISKHDDDVDCERSPRTLTRPNLRRESIRHRRVQSTSCLSDPVDHLEETFSKGDFDFLEGCRIWVCGADQTRFDKWKRILDRSGATRVANVEAASHVVVVNVSSSERTRLIQAQSRGVHIVRAEWVAACFIHKDQVPLKEFLWDPSDNVIQNVCPSTSAQRSEEIHDRPDSGLSPRSSKNATNSNDLGASDYLNLTAFCDVSDDPSLSNIFRLLKFRLYGLEPDVEFQIRKEVRSAGGTVVLTSDNCTHVNYLVCDQVEFGHGKSKGNFDEAVTAFWVKKCLLDRCLLKPSNHPLYRPLPAVKGSTVFSSTVVVLSCFGGYERFTLSNLIKRFGGTVQETLTRRGQGDQLAVTHVIGGSEGARVIEARRQRFKVVDPSWIVESIINDKRMKEDHFPLEKEAYASYKGRTDDFWPEAVRTDENTFSHDAFHVSLGAKVSKDDFSDFFMDGFPDDGDEEGPIPHSKRNELSVEANTKLTDARKTSTPVPSVPTRLPFAKPNDRTLDMKKPFKANFCGLSQVMPSPVSSNSDISADSLSTSTMGRILKEAATKTALCQRRCKSDQSSMRKSISAKTSVMSVKELAPLNDADSPVGSDNDMMALRARMTERLEQRNREIANQLPVNKSPPAISASVYPSEEVGLCRRRKHFHKSTNVGSSDSGTSKPLPPSPQEITSHPLIVWQPAMPTRVSSSTLHDFDEPLDQTPVPMHEEETTSGIPCCGAVTIECREKYARSTLADPVKPNPFLPAASVAASMDKASYSNLPPVAAPLPHIRSSLPLIRKPAEVPARMSSIVNVQFKSRNEPAFTAECSEHTQSRTLPHTKEAVESKIPIVQIPSIKKEPTSITVSSPVRRFIFTSVIPQERLRLSNIITRLGGIADPGELSDDCTHLICGKLIRGSKLMGCIASGKWVLSADYVDRSLDARAWLSEADFEVGNPSRVSVTNLSERELKLAQACRRWRMKLASTDPSKRIGAFHGWRCLLYCSDEKATGLIPMLKAGGAEVAVRRNGEGTPLTFRPTHAVVCTCNMWNMEELEVLVSIGAKVFHLDYISKFLLEELIEESASYHADYKKYLQKFRR